jgi:predicted GH43/DUF377 family glycosyl hydrolase
MADKGIMRRRFTLATAAVFAVALLAAPSAFACSKDDTAYLDSFLDLSCVQTTTNTELDAFGGIRLTTNGNPEPTLWDTDTDFDNGVTYQTTLFPPVGVSTLAGNGMTGTDAALVLPDTTMPLLRDAANPILAPTPSDPGQLDNDNVDDAAAVRVGSTYVMYYSGTAEDGSGPAIFRATSTDGKAWTKTGVVLSPSPNSPDERGVFAPSVIYDADADEYTMWYSGRDDNFTAIFKATSDDGITWTKYPDDVDPDPVLDHGRAGSADSFGAQDPSVIKDGTTWKMWYTGDDSNRKRVAYATSPDGTAWEKGGRVISPEDGLPANLADGAFAPTVWKTGDTYKMILSGLKITGSTGQTKLINASSDDGIAWTIGSIALNQAGTSTKFDFSNLNSPFVLQDPDAAGNSEDFKLYYSGNTIDPVTGGFHTRIGLATSGNGNSWSRFTGSGFGSSDLDIGTLGTAFDSRTASGPAVVQPGGASEKFVGFYWGNRGSDFKPRLGEATSADGSAWDKVAGAQTGNSILALGNGAAFDAGGQRDPSALYVQDTGMSQPDYHLWFTALTSARAQSIGYANDQEDAVSLLPDGSWASKAQAFAADGSGFDATGVSHPSVVKDGSTFTLFYTGTDASGNTAIGRATSANANLSGATRGANAVLAPTPGSFDASGVKDPVAYQIDATHWVMTYTGVEKRTDPGGKTETIERVGLATSSDGATWTKAGLLLNPSRAPYSFDETGVGSAGFIIDGTAIHFLYDGIDRTGRSRGGHATGDTGTTSGQVENGWATYQVGDPSKTVRDWQTITGTSTGTGVTIWVSFLQPYSSVGQQFWSDFFPIDAANTSAALGFLLTVRGARWQARESDPSGNPALDSIEIDSAPVQFNSSGSASTKEIAPPATTDLVQWRELTASASTYAPNGGTASGTVKVLNAAGTTTLASQALNTGGDTTINLSGISVTDNPTLRVKFDLQGGQASPLVESLKVLYYTTAAPPPAAVVTLSANPATIDPGGTSTLSGTVTQGGNPFASQTVTILSKPGGSGSFSPLTTTTTDGAGKFSLAVTPAATTDYQASAGGGTSPTATVTVNPPKPVITLAANPTEVVFGQTAALSGNVTQSGAPVVAQPVSLLQQPAGSVAFTPFGNATTDAAGNFTSTVTPQSNTAYQASFGGAASPSATVNVHQAVTLKATRRLKTGTFTGTIAPAHPSKEVVVQLKKGSSFVTFVKTKTTSTSTFSVKKRLKPCGKFTFRAVTAADADHLDGTSAIALVEKHRVSIKVTVKGRKITITGKVSPKHTKGTVLIREIKGKRAVKLGKAKITKKSTFRFVKKLKKGKHKVRADMGSDRCHFAGRSRVRSIRAR